MNEALRNILVLNGGSSSVKFALYSASPHLHTTVRGQIERIGMSEPMLSVQGSDHNETFTRQVDAHAHRSAVALLMDWIAARQKSGDGGLIAVGHRVVHGGSQYVEPQRQRRHCWTSYVSSQRSLQCICPTKSSCWKRCNSAIRSCHRSSVSIPPFTTICRMSRGCWPFRAGILTNNDQGARDSRK